MSGFDTDTEMKLVALLRKGDQAAYARIFHRYKEALYRHAYNLLGDLDEAEDVVQEVFLTLWQKRETLGPITSIRAYLYKATRNRVFNLMSHREVVVRYQESISRFWEQGRYTIDEQIRAKELANIIEYQVQALPPGMKKMFLLSREEGLSHKAIGAQLNISPKTAKLQVAKALKILKLRIGSFFFFF